MEFKDLLGKTLKSVEGQINTDLMEFTTDNGEKYRLTHYQDCCENVLIEDITGELSDLIGSPLLMAEEISNNEDIPGVDNGGDSFTWTFYKLATIKGYVTIRWLGSSNGYYSESVSFEKI